MVSSKFTFSSIGTNNMRFSLFTFFGQTQYVLDTLRFLHIFYFFLFFDPKYFLLRETKLIRGKSEFLHIEVVEVRGLLRGSRGGRGTGAQEGRWRLAGVEDLTGGRKGIRDLTLTRGKTPHVQLLCLICRRLDCSRVTGELVAAGAGDDWRTGGEQRLQVSQLRPERPRETGETTRARRGHRRRRGELGKVSEVLFVVLLLTVLDMERERLYRL